MFPLKVLISSVHNKCFQGLRILLELGQPKKQLNLCIPWDFYGLCDYFKVSAGSFHGLLNLETDKSSSDKRSLLSTRQQSFLQP
jgi:hypothetical protein